MKGEQSKRLLRKRATTTLLRRGRWRMNLILEPRDLWVGVFWKEETAPGVRPGWHVYVCLLPMIVLHFFRIDDREAFYARRRAEVKSA